MVTCIVLFLHHSRDLLTTTHFIQLTLNLEFTKYVRTKSWLVLSLNFIPENCLNYIPVSKYDLQFNFHFYVLHKTITITTVEHFPPITGVLCCFYHQVAVTCNNQCSFSKAILSFKMMKFHLQLYVTMFLI